MDKPFLSTEVKVGGTRTKYKAVELCDESVFDLATHFYTTAEISEFFNITEMTLLNYHGDAFRLGKAHTHKKPRMLLKKIFDDFSDTEINFSRQDVNTGVLLKAMEFHAKKYEGLGSKTTVVHENANYDKVESYVEIIERPDEDS